MGMTVTRTVRCDGCPAVILPGPDLEAGAMVGISVLAYRMNATDPLWFCGWRCLAAYAGAVIP